MSKVLIDSRRGCRRLATGAPTVILTRKPESIRLEKLWISDGPLATQIRYGVLK